MPHKPQLTSCDICTAICNCLMTIEVNTTPLVLFVQQSVIVWWFIFAANLGAIHITLVRKPQSHTCGFAPDLYVNITQPSFPLLFLAPCSLPVLPCSLASLAPFPCFFTLLCAPFPCPFPLLLATCPCFLLLFHAECSFSLLLAPHLYVNTTQPSFPLLFLWAPPGRVLRILQ